MTDEGKLSQAIGNAARATAYLQDEWLAEVENARIADLIEGWKSTSPGDVDGRERIFRQFHEVAKFRENLQRIAAAGRLAQAELDMNVKMVQNGNT